MVTFFQMTKYGAYSESQIYSPKEVRDLVLYARLRGVKILPELDAPAHSGIDIFRFEIQFASGM